MWLDELNNSLTTYLVLEELGVFLVMPGFGWWQGKRR